MNEYPWNSTTIFMQKLEWNLLLHSVATTGVQCTTRPHLTASRIPSLPATSSTSKNYECLVSHQLIAHTPALKNPIDPFL